MQPRVGESVKMKVSRDRKGNKKLTQSSDKNHIIFECIFQRKIIPKPSQNAAGKPLKIDEKIIEKIIEQ